MIQRPLNMDEKWERVKRHYNGANYKHPKTNEPMKFINRLSDFWVNYLFKRMIQLTDEEFEFRQGRVK